MLRLVLNHVHDTATNGDATRAVTPVDYPPRKLFVQQKWQILLPPEIRLVLMIEPPPFSWHGGGGR
jgi:hypothetical protein